MPRRPKPYFRKQTQSWYFSTGGKQIPLGKDKEEAFETFHQLMADKSKISGLKTSLYDLSQVYLDWVQDNLAPDTYKLRKPYLEGFIKHVGKRLTVAALKPHHMTKWTNKDTWNSTTRNDAIKTVQRMINWAVDEGYFESNPIARMKKPRRKTRQIVYTPDQWKQIKKHAKGSLVDYLDFLWLTGCRPKEARTVEARHIHGDMVIFPPDESKGEKDARVIFMTDEVKAIADRLAKKHAKGVLFRNSRGNRWTKDSVKDRLTRISTKVGFRVIAYGARHSYTTNALIRKIDMVSLATLLGHRDTRMISEVYAHLSSNTDFLKEQAKNAVRPSEAS